MSVPLRWQQPVEPQEVVQAPRPQHRRRINRRAQQARAIGTLALLTILCAITAAVGIGLTRWPVAVEQSLRLMPEEGSGTQVTLSAATVERRLGFLTVTGTMRNHGKRTLNHVEAVVELLDSANRTIALESALLPLDTVRVGQSVPFQVAMQDRAGVVAYRVYFRRLLGASLD